MSEFQRVGSVVAYGESLVEKDDVQPIHDIAARELMLAARSTKIELSDDSDYIAYSIYCPQPPGSYESNDRFVSVQMAHESLPDSWRLALNFRSFNNASNKRICYRFETFGEELMQATKEVFFVFANSEIDFDENNEPIHHVTYERKMYQRPVVVDDCRTVVAMLSRTINRLRVLRD